MSLAGRDKPSNRAPAVERKAKGPNQGRLTKASQKSKLKTRRSPTLSDLKTFAEKAGRLTLRYFQKSFDLWEKSDFKGIVTEADLASEKLLKALISEKFPGHAILAEESGWTELKNEASNSGDKPVWFIDPIDGTTNFSRGNPYYCVSLAFGYQDSSGMSDIHLGVVYQPATGYCFSAEKGRGAFFDGRRLQLKGRAEFRKGLFATGIGSQHGDALTTLFETMRRVQAKCSTTAIRVNGAAALDLALVAAGVFDGFWEKVLNPWDTAAGQLLVREAGGIVQNFSGEDYDTLRDPGIIAGHPDLIRELVREIRSADSD